MATTRTTITVDLDLLEEIKRRALDLHSTVSEFFQDSARERLSRIHEKAKPFRLTPVDTGGYQPGVDVNDNAALLDIMER
ncbi:ribbon-helix-helix domain-containing protein [Saccharopolyspora sp. 5N708]|uniref:ribbon-helix-helix domain-containing protein n=1 Tax=Saccharopolyspora sp. 5N708 TaxID=3457424 RepID=UPI003FD09894